MGVQIILWVSVCVLHGPEKLIEIIDKQMTFLQVCCTCLIIVTCVCHESTCHPVRDFDVASPSLLPLPACLPAFATCHFYSSTFFRYEQKNVWENYCATFLAIFLFSFGCRYVIANLPEREREMDRKWKRKRESVCYAIRLGKSFKCSISRVPHKGRSSGSTEKVLSLSPSRSQHSFGSKCCQAVWHGLLRSALRFGVFVVVFLKFRFRLGEMCRAHVQPACLLTTKNNGNK